jgi:molybdopterin-guanine dinucleotide biosynthesis adapter protein
MSSAEEGDGPGRTVKVLGIAGWKNSGKTTLAARLISELTLRGLRVAAVKHSHHDVVLDAEGTDSARLAEAGAAQVAVVSPARWGIRHEIAQGGAEPELAQVIAALGPADLVVVEGYKRAAIAKIEVRRRAAKSHEPLAGADPLVVAVAADHMVEAVPCPVFALDDVAAIADFILSDAVLTNLKVS